MTSDNIIRAYLALSFLCGIINIPPTLLHVVQGHSGPGAFGVWAVVLNLLAFVNGLLWRHDAVDRAPIFCDLSSHVSQVGPLGLLIGNCCIMRYLAKIMTPNTTVEDQSEKRRRAVFDYSISFGFPAVLAALSTIFQVARYQVNRYAGCSSASALVWPTFVLSVIWPPIFCGIACGYSFYVSYWLLQRHREIKKLVEFSHTPLNVSRFIRMGALSTTYFFISTPCAVYGTLETLAATGPFVPWFSWATVHNEDNNLSIIRQYPLYQYQLRDWLPIAAGLIVLMFFSFGAESQAFYKKLGLAALRIFTTRQKHMNKSFCISVDVARSHCFKT
ncbi:GPCR fungal pheromone mating factor [Phakopsora pachyrhizi]|uniref:GPCR fungal pheromone mating factor n=1 Tax=Phakopsora pachyrhizi TaxID=170000 RepID=A0AAV0AGE7_PHAPC|nr:GPCR fungal pheromone mating factor [Phakopsora pachyrhizi]